jgi:3-hydroxybutyrate dehydrogenase
MSVASVATGLGFAGRFLAKKTVLVTGSTSGIGLGIAEVLAQHGGNIILNSYEKKTRDIEEIVAGFTEDFGVKTEYFSADMSCPDEIRSLIKRIEDHFGSVDVVINNAGIQYVSPIQTFPDDMWDKIIATNLSSAFHTTKAALPGMTERGYGRIINVASAHGLVASVNKAPYVAAKHGIVGLTKAVALETATTPDLTVNAVCPGFVLTRLVRKQIEARAQEAGVSYDEAALGLLEKHPSKKFVTVEDLGNMCAYLCSPYTTQLTGQALAMDAGWTAQ